MRSSLPIHPVLNERYSPRSFSERDISDAELELLLEAARWAPSSHNDQPWRFLVTRRGQDGHEALLSALVPFNKAWVASAPVLMLNMVMRDFSYNREQNHHAWHDMGGAVVQLTAQATSMGIGVHQLAGLNTEDARTAFAIPTHLDIVSALALGFPGDPALLPENLMQRELVRSSRKPLSELVSFGAFRPTTG